MAKQHWYALREYTIVDGDVDRAVHVIVERDAVASGWLALLRVRGVTLAATRVIDGGGLGAADIAQRKARRAGIALARTLLAQAAVLLVCVLALAACGGTVGGDGADAPSCTPKAGVYRETWTRLASACGDVDPREITLAGGVGGDRYAVPASSSSSMLSDHGACGVTWYFIAPWDVASASKVTGTLTWQDGGERAEGDAYLELDDGKATCKGHYALALERVR
jgi:hypothetical protein